MPSEAPVIRMVCFSSDIVASSALMIVTVLVVARHGS